ncbi:hypothetical protein [Streptomyces sp. LaPpAH-108]|uniref:hypothetical protein n=1 Tax=Streptomyces sp. LaPpAH-108 TaxID=1155714 RepID=UPI00036F3CE3|nr:hypothetical protein [Streptomyces sp. LaPpAH-108]
MSRARAAVVAAALSFTALAALTGVVHGTDDSGWGSVRAADSGTSHSFPRAEGAAGEPRV